MYEVLGGTWELSFFFNQRIQPVIASFFFGGGGELNPRSPFGILLYSSTPLLITRSSCVYRETINYCV